jgi:hypothetical protein
MEKRRYSSTILELGTESRCVANFTPRPLYPRGKGPQYPFDSTDLLGPIAGKDAVRSKEKSLAPAGNRNLAVQPVLESLCRLSYLGFLYVTSIKIKFLPTEAILDVMNTKI